GDRQAGDHAGGEVDDRVAAVRQQVHGPDEGGELRLADAARDAEQPRDVVQVGDRGHAAGELRVGRDVPDPAADVGGVGRDDPAEHLGPPGGRPVEAEDQPQERGLAGVVGPEQTQDAARLDGQRHVVERDLAVLVDLGEVLGLDDQLGRFRHGRALPDSLRSPGGYTRGNLPGPCQLAAPGRPGVNAGLYTNTRRTTTMTPAPKVAL